MGTVEDTIAETFTRVAATPGLDAVLLVGSTAANTRRPNSDIDIIVTIRDDHPWPMPFRDGGREVVLDEAGRQVEVAYTTVGRARTRMRENAMEGRPWGADGLARSHALGPIGEATGGLIAEAKALIAAGPPALDDGERRWLCYEAWNHVKDAEDYMGEPATANLLASSALDTLTRLTFWLASRWQPHPKRLVLELADVDEVLRQTTVQFLTSADPAQRLSLLRTYQNRLSELHGIQFEVPYLSPPMH